MKNEAYQRAEEKIAIALHESATKLDLSCSRKANDSDKLTELPNSMGQLTQLKSLTLSGNKLSNLPDSVEQLTELESLYLHNNQFSYLPESLKQLTQLKSLVLRNNQLDTLPEFIGKLTQLQSLDLSKNKLVDLPESLSQLNQLQSLNLAGNQLSNLPEFIMQLAQLQFISLSGNKLLKLSEYLGQLAQLRGLYISSLPLEKLPDSISECKEIRVIHASNCRLKAIPNWIGKLNYLTEFLLEKNQLKDLPNSLAQLPRLERLELDNNPLNPELAAAYDQGLDAVKAYLNAKNNKIILDEAKLILVGEGGVGKTSLLGALRGDEWEEDRATTHGVEVDIKSMQLTDADSGKTITFNCWDFGGQNIYRHTHQLYFTAPAVYLAVWEPRRGPEQSVIEEWAKMIKQRAYDETRPQHRPRILVVATHGGPKERLDHIDEQALRDEFGNLIVGFHHIDSKTGAGMDELKAAIAHQAAAIPSVGREVPKSWQDVLETLRKYSEQKAFISYAQFVKICEQCQVNAKLARTYANILNELGHIIYYRGDAVLQDTVILKAEWLSKAMSYVLEDKQTKASYGLVTHARLAEIWDDPARNDRYPAAIHKVFLKLMDKFDLAYQIKLQEKEAPATSLIAQLVPYNRPDDWQRIWQAEANNNERTQVCRIVDASTGRTTEVEGLMYRLIVRLHRYSLGKRDYRASCHWKTGMLLDDGFNGRALLEDIGGDIHVTVRAAYPERFLHLLCEEVRWLVESFWKGLDCRLSVLCLIDGCKGLLEFQEMHDNLQEDIHKVRCPVCRKWHNINDKLGASAVKPAYTKALADLKQGQAEIIRGMESGFEAVNTDLRRLISQADEQFAALMTTLTDPAKDGPRLFSFVALKTGFFDKPNWIAQKFRLTLWCEHSRLPLPILTGDTESGVYEIELKRDWLKRAAPLLKAVSTTLSLALPVAASANKLVDEALLKSFEEQLDFAKNAAETLISANEQIDEWLVSDDQLEVETSSQQLIRAQGATLRELHSLLKAKDSSDGFGGLERVQNKKREFLWVHERFIEEY